VINAEFKFLSKMDESKLCFFEELAATSGKFNSTQPQHEVHSIFLLETDEIFNKINSGNYLEVLEKSEFKSFLATGNEKFDKNEKLGVAVACLFAFIQDNFTGPDIDEIRFESFESEKWKIERIAVDGIEINANIRNISLLLIARNFIEDLVNEFPSDLVSFIPATCCTIQ
jgi:hypothetical protein